MSSREDEKGECGETALTSDRARLGDRGRGDDQERNGGRIRRS